MMFPARSSAQEIMDDMSIEDGRIDRALDELCVINRWLGGHRTSRLGIERIARTIPAGRPISILDVGAGAADLDEALVRLGRSCVVISLDLNAEACRYVRRRKPTANVVNGSALALPFKGRSFDIVHASHVLHHFSDPDATRLIAHLAATARYGLVINDLRRHAFAYAAIRALTHLFSRSEMVRHDGPTSVLRAFHRNEIYSLLSSVSHGHIVLSRRWAFRWCAAVTFDSYDDPVAG
ncbi:MAG: hypothetical protein A3H45_01625 [Ignavibacteria bacterium RIFCSPLOWO2_02_FULL_55_14]|nr:MAG: hypothetical protein A3H45_01625 [Ignavibacteria bacterium RIFCSPLOWO2_02_FULL_55_14]